MDCVNAGEGAGGEVGRSDPGDGVEGEGVTSSDPASSVSAEGCVGVESSEGTRGEGEEEVLAREEGGNPSYVEAVEKKSVLIKIFIALCRTNVLWYVL